MSGCCCGQERCLHEAFAGSGRVSVGLRVERIKDKLGGQILHALLLMVGGAVMLREVVDAIGWARAPVISEVLLVVTIAQPPVSHVHCFCESGKNVVGYHAEGGAVICLDGGRGLGVT
jgi:hypothetical protein